MQLKIIIMLFSIFAQINGTPDKPCPNLPINSCSKIFKYRCHGSEYYGLLTLHNTGVRNAIKLQVTLMANGNLMMQYLGKIKLLSRIQSNSDEPIRYRVDFPKTPYPPSLTEVKINERVICSVPLALADPDIVHYTKIILDHDSKLQAPELDGPVLFNMEQAPAQSEMLEYDDSWQDISHFTKAGAISESKFLPFYGAPHPKIKAICGKAVPILQALRPDSAKDFLTNKNATQLANDGAKNTELDTVTDTEALTTRGAWPWLTAIYVNNGTTLSYQCAGTLITDRVIVSAAHCFRLVNKNYTASEVVVMLGRHNLKNLNEESSLLAQVTHIFIHPEFDKYLKSYDADIAVIILKEQIKRFNTFIRPACLWSGDTELHLVEGHHGVVVSYRLSKSESAAARKRNDVTIITHEDCFGRCPDISSLVSERNFCASNHAIPQLPRQRENIGVCTGDSGAGLMLLKDNRWVLRGIVSGALPSDVQTGDFNCTLNQHIIYTDVAQFLDWILAFTF